VKGTLWEANIFGSYVAGMAALSGGLLLSRIRTIDRRLLCVVFTVAVVAVVLSLTRGAWLGFAAGAILTVFFLRGARLSAVLLVVLVAVIGTAAVFQFDLGNTTQDVSARFATMSSLRSDSTTSSRLKNVDRALSEWRQRPLLGWGTDGYHINHPDILSRLPCPELNALYDTGLVGLAAFALLVGAIFFRSAVASTRHREEALATVLGALTIAGITQFIAFQVTDAFWLGFIWIYFGLMLGAVRLINEGAPA
jgi:O-antigen ligase